jgi:hypothetical protein
MAVKMTTRHIDVPSKKPVQRQWNMPTRVIFRLAFVYLALYTLVPLFFFAQTNLHAPTLRAAHEHFWRSGLWSWAATHMFGATPADAGVLTPDGFLGWLHIVWLLTIAAVASALWSILDPKRLEYRRLHVWLRLIVRIALALTLTAYGAEKIWPVQFPLARPHQLLGQLSDYSPAQLLWVFIGTSRGYEAFTGAVELLGAVLLFVPQSTTLGALVALAATTNVFMLNVFYDVTVKNFSLHLVLMALFLLIPDIRRLVNVFVLNRGAAPADHVPLFRRKGLARAAFVVQIAIGIAAITQSLMLAKTHSASMNVFDQSRVPWYGVWNVTEFRLDGIAHPPLTTDELRWQRVVFDYYFNASIQRMNGAVVNVRTRRDARSNAIAFDRTGEPNPEARERYGPTWKADFTAEMRSSDLMVLHGQYNGHPAEIVLRREDTNFPLSSHETHWIIRGPAHPGSPYF